MSRERWYDPARIYNYHNCKPQAMESPNWLETRPELLILETSVGWRVSWGGLYDVGFGFDFPCHILPRTASLWLYQGGNMDETERGVYAAVER